MIINQMPGLALGNTTATKDKIFNGYTAYDGNGELIIGNFTFVGNATEDKIVKGYSAYGNSSTLLNGSIPSYTTLD